MSESPGVVGPEVEETRLVAGSGFSLTFARAGGRWTHSIEAARSEGGRLETLARSVEWDRSAPEAGPDRVVSPVFQELHLDEGPDGATRAFLVGMSGNHHFSAVFEASEGPEGAAIRVDLADRCRGEVHALSSTYTVLLDSGDLQSADESAIGWTLGGRPIEFRSGPDARASLAEAGRRATRVQAAPSGADIGPTRRWSYSWRIARF